MNKFFIRGISNNSNFKVWKFNSKVFNFYFFGYELVSSIFICLGLNISLLYVFVMGYFYV